MLKKNACYSQTKISSENSITLWTSQGSQIASVSEHAIDNTLRFGSHINYLRQKFMKMLGFYCRNKSCFSVDVRKKLVFSTFLMFDHGDVIYQHAPSYLLASLDALNHGALGFITDCKFSTHHCELYRE